MSRKHRRNQQPQTMRGVPPPVPPGGKLRRIDMNYQLGQQYGTGNVPTDLLNMVAPGNQVPTTFLPGDPVRATPGLNDGNGGPRVWGYPIGGNIAPTPRGTEFTPFEQLRSLAANYYGIGLCLEVHNRIIQRLVPQFTPRDGMTDPGEDITTDKWTRPARQMQEWLLDGPNSQYDGGDLYSWLTAYHRDIMEVDAVAVYHVPTRGGFLDALRLVHPDTLQVLTDPSGQLPQPPNAAYRQVLYGAPADGYSKEEIDYLRYAARTDSLYGISPVERILLTVNQALRKQNFDLRRFTDGATPAGLLTNDAANITWSPDQVRKFEQEFNAILAGNDALRNRVKVLVPGWKFQQTQAEVISTEFDMFLLTVCAAAYGVTKDELGFTDTSNKSVGDSQQNVIYRNAIKPRTDFLARYLSRIVRRYDNTPLSAHDATVSRANSPTKSVGKWDARFQLVWGGIEEPEDFNAKATAIQALFTAGILTRLQAKKELKLTVDPGEEDTPAFAVVQGGMDGIVVLQDIETNRELEQQARQTKVDAAKASLDITQKQSTMLANQIQQQQDQAAQAKAEAAEEAKWESSGGEEGTPPPGEGNGDTGQPTPPDNGPGGGNAPPKPDSNESDTGATPPSASGNASAETAPPAQPAAKNAPPGEGDADEEEETPPATRMAQPADPAAITTEWRNYRDRALRAAKRGEVTPLFTSDILPPDQHAWVAERIAGVVSPDTVRATFTQARLRQEVARIANQATVSPLIVEMEPAPAILPAPASDDATGVMVALMLPQAAAEQIAVPGGLPPSDLHITLCYVGDLADGPIDRDRLMATVQAWSAQQHPLYVDLDRLDRFPGDGEKAPIIVRSDTAVLQDVHSSLCAALDAAGIDYPHTFPTYSPHVTLCYVPADAPTPALPAPDLHLCFTACTVAYGMERVLFPLGMPAPTFDARAEVLGELRTLRAQVTEALRDESLA